MYEQIIFNEASEKKMHYIIGKLLNLAYVKPVSYITDNTYRTSTLIWISRTETNND